MDTVTTVSTAAAVVVMAAAVAAAVVEDTFVPVVVATVEVGTVVGIGSILGTLHIRVNSL